MPKYEGLLAETVTYAGHGGDVINAYAARPLGSGPYPDMGSGRNPPVYFPRDPKMP